MNNGVARGSGRWWAALMVALLLIWVPGCAEPTFPKDTEGTLERATGGVLRVGATENPPFVDLVGDEPSGTEVAIIEDYAATIDAELVWTLGAEGRLMELLKAGELDVVIGGLASDLPWTDHAAFTAPYATTQGIDGPIDLVMATRLGENALLTNLERFLAGEGLRV